MRTAGISEKKNKNILLVVLTMILLLRLFYIFCGDEIDREYFTAAQFDLSEAEKIPCSNLKQTFIPQEKRLSSLELLFTGIEPDQQTELQLALLTSDGALIYQSNLKLSAGDNDVWRHLFVNAELDTGKEYTVFVNAVGEQKDIFSYLVHENAESIFPDAFEEDTRLSGQIAINFGYLRTPSTFDKLVISSLYLLAYVLICMAFFHFAQLKKTVLQTMENIKKQVGETTLVCAAEILTCLLIIECSGIEFQPLTRVMMLSVSAALSLNWEEKSKMMSCMLDSNAKKTGYAFLCFYTAFAMVGQRIFIYPLNQRITAEGVLVFASAAIWSFPLLHSLLYVSERFCRKAFRQNREGSTDRKSRIGFLIVLVIILLLPAVYNLIANNPGISDVDTYESFEKYAQNPYGMYNWHPLFYSLLLRKIQQVWNSTYAVILVHYVFWTYVLLELFLYLKKRGARDSVLIVLALLFGSNAANFLHLNTIWKDIPYAIAMIWLLLICAKLSIDQDFYKKKWYIYLELIAATVLVGMLRKNGLVPLLVTLVPMLVIFRKNIKLIAASLLTVLLIFYIKGPVYSRYDIIEPGRRGIYIGLGQDILGTYYAGGDVSNHTSQMIVEMTGGNPAEYDYNPTWAHQNYDLDVEPAVFIRDYLDTFIRNPRLMTRAIIARQDCLWDVFEGEDAIVQNTNYTDTEDGDRRWNEFYDVRIFRSIYPWMSELTAYTVEAQWINVWTWRCGATTLLGLAALAFLLLRRGPGKYLLIALPIAGQILSLLLSTGWTDFRYYWPVNLLNLAMLPLLFSTAREKNTD